VRPKRHGAPREGVSLAASTEVRGKPVRDAVAILASGVFPDKLDEVFLQTFSAGQVSARNPDLLTRQAAWNLVAICLIARSSDQCSSQCGFQEAESWFRNGSYTTAASLSAQFPSESLWEAEQLLNTVQLDSEFQSLFPYILEEHGPGSRASVLKDPTTALARAAKRQLGVFYTPADVADYMVEHTRQIYQGDFLTAKSLDPACGTGVFFLAMLRAAIHSRDEVNGFSQFDYITNCLHGLDISAHALDAAAFVLLRECLSEILARKFAPLAAWRLIRRNLVEADALCVDAAGRKNEISATWLFESHLPNLAQLFPQVQNGFDILVGNPPYAALGKREDFASLKTRFASMRGVKAAIRLNLFPLFVEMMWQYTKPGCNASALVTPLSLAFHGGAQFENCRQAMSWHGGRWQFAFFDREPHALFGEEVKTRNAILFRSEGSDTPKRGQAANIETGPLRKWTSRTRERLFQNIKFTSVDSIEITSGIPKLDGETQSRSFMALRRRFERLPSLALRIGTCKPVDALAGKYDAKVFVGGTAYNFLNVYRPTSLLAEERGMTLSESSVHCLEFKAESEACVAFAVLSSRLTFWLWHVLGDGFHVAGWLFDEVPFGRESFTDAQFAALSSLGNALWLKLQTHRFTSLNSGRLTIGFRPLACQKERDDIDVILAKVAGLSDEFVAELRSFVQKNAVVDSTDTRRSHVSKHFTESTKG
jgi:predicted RNA methylase